MFCYVLSIRRSCKAPNGTCEKDERLLQGRGASSNGDTAEARHAGADAAGAPLQEQSFLPERQSDGGQSLGRGESLGRASRRSSMQDADSEQARRDADLEAAVLDTLTDSVLTGASCSHFNLFI